MLEWWSRIRSLSLDTHKISAGSQGLAPRRHTKPEDLQRKRFSHVGETGVIQVSGFPHGPGLDLFNRAGFLPKNFLPILENQGCFHTSRKNIVNQRQRRQSSTVISEAPR